MNTVQTFVPTKGRRDKKPCLRIPNFMHKNKDSEIKKGEMNFTLRNLHELQETAHLKSKNLKVFFAKNDLNEICKVHNGDPRLLNCLFLRCHISKWIFFKIQF